MDIDTPHVAFACETLLLATLMRPLFEGSEGGGALGGYGAQLFAESVARQWEAHRGR